MTTVDFMRKIEKAMQSELYKGVIAYYDGEDNGCISYDLTYTQHYFMQRHEEAAKKSILDFAEQHNAVGVSDNKVNTIRLTFRVEE